MLTESREGQRPSREQKDLYTCPEHFTLMWNMLSGSWPAGNRRGVAHEAQPQTVLVQSLPSRLRESPLPSLVGPWGQLWPMHQSGAAVAFRASGLPRWGSAIRYQMTHRKLQVTDSR